jgi:hypothetical protein
MEFIHREGKKKKNLKDLIILGLICKQLYHMIRKCGIALLLLGSILLFSTCNKSSGNVINISGFSLRDVNGNTLGRMGASDSDWYFVSHLSARELALFDLQPSGSLNNTAVPDSINALVAAFPNPVSSVQQFYFRTNDSVLVKLIIVDASLKVLQKTAIKNKGGISLILDFSDRSIYPNRSVCRAYYSLSAQGAPNFAAGYGDIKICDSSNVTDCF